jgi:hypothetical protein
MAQYMEADFHNKLINRGALWRIIREDSSNSDIEKLKKILKHRNSRHYSIQRRNFNPIKSP